MRHTYRVTAALGVALLCGGCATVSPELERQRQQAARHVHDRPIDEVWTHVKALLDAEGYSYMEEPGTFVLVTEFRELLDGADAVSVWRRYLVKAHALDAERDFNPRHNGALRYRGRNAPSIRRDLSMEWELVRRAGWLPADSATSRRRAAPH